MRSVLRVQSQYGNSRLQQDFIAYRHLQRIDVRVVVDWHEQFKLLKLQFPLNIRANHATYEIPYGHIERPANGEEEPGQGWVDVSGISLDNGAVYGLSVLNDAKYSFDVDGNTLSLTVLRSPVYAHHDPFVPNPGEDYEFVDQGTQQFVYSLLPHSGDWRAAETVRRAAELNQPANAVLEPNHPGGTLALRDSYLAVDPDNVIASVVKKSEDDDSIVIRCYETNKTATDATIRLPKWNRTIKTRFGPCEIKTIIVPKDVTAPVSETNLLEWAD